MMSKTLLASLLALATLGGSAFAQNPVIKVKGEVDGTFVDPDFEVTLWDDGSITVEVPGPNPDPGQIPPGLIPPNAGPAPTVDVGLCDDKEDAKAKVAGAIIGHLIAKWIEHGLDELRAYLESIGLIGEHVRVTDPFTDTWLDSCGPLPGVEAMLLVDPVQGQQRPVFHATWTQECADLITDAVVQWQATQP